VSNSGIPKQNATVSVDSVLRHVVDEHHNSSSSIVYNQKSSSFFFFLSLVCGLINAFTASIGLFAFFHATEGLYTTCKSIAVEAMKLCTRQNPYLGPHLLDKKAVVVDQVHERPKNLASEASSRNFILLSTNC
jgi:hypothetical protein